MDAIEALPPHRRGYAFETFLNRLFKVSGLNPSAPFRNTGEQIDGSFVLQAETYLIEAKWEKKPTGAADLRSFQGKVADKATWARGLFIAFEDFSREGLLAFGRGKQIILMSGDELKEALRRNIALGDVLDRKVRAAVHNGWPFNRLSKLYVREDIGSPASAREPSPR